MRHIGLLDCNNFFVSCERLFRPDLLYKPVAVLSSNDGCIVSRSQEVKAMGVPMGLPFFQAKQLVDVDKIIFFSSNFTLYRDISARVMNILAEEVGECEVYSIDEAFFELEDPTEAELTALRESIMRKTGIPVSIGAAATKTLAKEASEIGKRGSGVCLLTEELWQERAPQTSCGEIWGLGRATAAKLNELGIKSVAQYMGLGRGFIRKNFGIGGERIYDELHGTIIYGLFDGVDDTRKSATSSRSFAQATHNLAALESAIAYHVSNVAGKLRDRQLASTIMYLELRASRHSDFAYRQGSTEVVLDIPSNSTQKLTALALAAVRRVFDKEVPYKKAGVTLSGLVPEAYVSEPLFVDPETSRQKVVDQLLDQVQRRFGFSALHNASILPSRDRSSRRLRSKAYTTVWGDIPTIRA